MAGMTRFISSKQVMSAFFRKSMNSAKINRDLRKHDLNSELSSKNIKAPCFRAVWSVRLSTFFITFAFLFLCNGKVYNTPEETCR